MKTNILQKLFEEHSKKVDSDLVDIKLTLQIDYADKTISSPILVTPEFFQKGETEEVMVKRISNSLTNSLIRKLRKELGTKK